MRVAASSPAWLTRSALSKNSRCAGVSGFDSGAGACEASGPLCGVRDISEGDG